MPFAIFAHTWRIKLNEMFKIYYLIREGLEERITTDKNGESRGSLEVMLAVSNKLHQALHQLRYYTCYTRLPWIDASLMVAQTLLQHYYILVTIPPRGFHLSFSKNTDQIFMTVQHCGLPEQGSSTKFRLNCSIFKRFCTNFIHKGRDSICRWSCPFSMQQILLTV